MNKSFPILTVFVILLAACGGDGSDLAPKASAASMALKNAAHRKCVQDKVEEACVEWGRLAMSVFPAEIAQAEAEKAEIARLARAYASQDLLGAEGAYTTKIGGLYAEKKDVIKAVEMVEEGLGIMQKGIQDHPEGKAIRIYYIETIANLPAIFGKKQETLDSISSLRAHFQLSEGEKLAVQDAQNRISNSVR